ncbi:MAG: acyltransferase family protein [Gemmatimonadales bacterium]
MTAIASPSIAPSASSHSAAATAQPARVDPLESARVQTLRGIACLLLVAFHAIGSSSASGLHVADSSTYRHFTNLFVHIRMPLFTFLSGLVYAYRPLRPEQVLEFSGKKLRRLGVPLIVATTVLYTLHLVTDHRVPPVSQVWTIYFFPYWHLWFVQALLLVFGAVIAFESLGALSNFRQYLLVFALSLVLYSGGLFQGHEILGLNNATYLLPFFLAGLAAHRYRDILQTPRALTLTLVCLIWSQGWHSYIVLTHTLPPIDPVAHRSALNLLIGISASLTALQLLPRLRFVGKIGGSSYPIYLYHPVFVAAALSLIGTRIPLPTSLLFVMAGTVGIMGPMLLEQAAARIPLGRLLLEGSTGGPSQKRPAAAGFSVEVKPAA